MLTVNELAKMIDQTLLKAYATDEDLIKHCEEVKKLIEKGGFEV